MEEQKSERGEVFFFLSFPFPLLSFSSTRSVLSTLFQPLLKAAKSSVCLPSLALFLLFLCAHLLTSLCLPVVSLCVSKPTDQFSRDITALVRGETDPTDCFQFSIYTPLCTL